MRNQSHRPPSNSRGYIVAGIIFTITAFGVWFLINRENVREFTDTYKSREEAQLAITQAKQRIGQLKRQEQSLAYNGVETEKQIRERLKMHKLGEQVIFFEKEDPKTTHTAQPTTPTSN